MEEYWNRFKELVQEKTYRACLEFEDLFKRACSIYSDACKHLGYSDLVKSYFMMYYGCSFELYYEDKDVDWELVSADDDFIEVEKNTYEDDELISSETFKYPRLFFNNVQYNKWKKWATEVSYQRLLKEKEELLKNIEKLYNRYKYVEKTLEILTPKQP